MNEILNVVFTIVALVLAGAFATFFVVLNLLRKKEFEEVVYGRNNNRNRR